ncbi:MAG: SGNH/GDSL hydrolase family protein [Maribacter sp.]
MNRREFTMTSALGITGSLLFGCADTKIFPFKKNQVIACIGDSVTYGGGNGYVEILQKLADKKHPDLNLSFLNWGKSSETITGLTEVGHPGPRPYLFERLDELLSSKKVDIVMFCYGINCGIYGKPSQKLFDSFQIGVLSFLQKVKAKNLKAILLTPPPLTLDTAPIEINLDEEFTWMNPYPKYDEEVIQEFKETILTVKHDALLTSIDIHSPLLKNQAVCYDKDPIHPNLNGHQLIADTIIGNLVF